LIALGAPLALNAALLVDQLAGLRSVSQLHAEADDDSAVRPAFAATRWRDADGRAWQAIDLAALAQDVRFLSIVA
jgi:twitching motility protein PilI